MENHVKKTLVKCLEKKMNDTLKMIDNKLVSDDMGSYELGMYHRMINDYKDTIKQLNK